MKEKQEVKAVANGKRFNKREIDMHHVILCEWGLLTEDEYIFLHNFYIFNNLFLPFLYPKKCNLRQKNLRETLKRLGKKYLIDMHSEFGWFCKREFEKKNGFIVNFTINATEFLYMFSKITSIRKSELKN